MDLRTVLVFMLASFSWGQGFNVLANSAMYHIFAGHGVLTEDLAQGYFMLGAAAMFACGFLLFLLGVRRAWAR